MNTARIQLVRLVLPAMILGLGLAACSSQTTGGGEVTVMPEKGDKGSDNVCWVEPTPELQARLSAEEWRVLVEGGTEAPFKNAYWNHHEPGVYVDAIDGTPLFASTAKFDSGTGWPSFMNPVDPASLVLLEDTSYGMVRTEVRSRSSGGHLGHVFDDGPGPGGRRWCINSAALDFVPAREMDARGLGGLRWQLGL